MHKSIFRLVAVAAFALGAFNAAATAQEVYYYSDPAGVVCEGAGAGIEAIETINYDPRSNAFALNGNAYYQNPISKEEFSEILVALSEHNFLGVSIRPDRSFFTYGRIPANSQVARTMSEADKLLGGVMFAVQNYIGNRRLPGNYRPNAVQNRRIVSAATFRFNSYVFAKDERGVYSRVSYNFDIRMRPIRQDRRAPDGGYLPDTTSTEIEPADRENFDHLMANRNAYMGMPEVEKVARIGEAAAFIRHLRGGSSTRGQLVGGRPQLLRDLAARMR